MNAGQWAVFQTSIRDPWTLRSRSMLVPVVQLRLWIDVLLDDGRVVYYYAG